MNELGLKPRLSIDGTLIATERGWRLGIPAGGRGRYRLAQLDDHAGRPRHAYPRYPPLALSLRARVSSSSIPGTWGFGLWNDPYGFTFGPGERFIRFPALPQAVWFFAASPKSYLSIRDDRPGRGFMAQGLSSSRFRPSLIAAGLALPLWPRTSRRLLGRLINSDSALVEASPVAWHSYRLKWSAERSVFWVDEKLVLEAAVSPRPPLGLVIWIDNQYAAFEPRGRLAWGLEDNPSEAWLEIDDLRLDTTGRSVRQ
jgi:hypothetical protein